MLPEQDKLIHWNNEQEQERDHVILPAIADYILFNPVKELDACLINEIQSHYQLKMAPGRHLMDIKADIFANIPMFFVEIQ